MDSDNQKKVKQICAHIALLMEHQHILPDLKEIVAEIDSTDEYSKGARDALTCLLEILERKGI